jgi:hypothetical protein
VISQGAAPRQSGSGNLRLQTTVARSLQVGPQTQTAGDVFLESTRRRPFHRCFRLCCRASTNNWALAASTSRTASWNSRPAFHAATHVLHPVLGDVLDTLLAPHHEGEGPDRMAWALAGGFAAAEMGQGERAGKQILGKMETTHEFEVALPESRGLSAFGFDVRLKV